MTKRSVVSVLLLTIVTFGIYGLFWYVMTKDEMNQEGAGIPTAFLLIVPFANIYWVWKWSCGVEQVTGGAMSRVGAFLLMVLLGLIGMLVIQSELNRAIDNRLGSDFPHARVA